MKHQKHMFFGSLKNKSRNSDVALNIDAISTNEKKSTFLGVLPDNIFNWKYILILYPVNYHMISKPKTLLNGNSIIAL